MAARKLIERLGWHGRFPAAETRDGYVFVFSCGIYAEPLTVWDHTHAHPEAV